MIISATTWNTLSKLLDEALDLAPEARAIWLERLQTTQPQFASSVQQLLAAHATKETADVLAGLPSIEDLTGSSAEQKDQLWLSAGDRVGPYLLKRELGAGGMADVWLAERADGAFARDVALKLPRINRLRRDLAIRFSRERDILARLEHPHIARLYDAGVTDDGLPYLAMEFVDGQPITDYCDTQRMPIKARLELFAQVLDAVQFAHANLIIHRDLKPSNIIVGTDGRVRLLDFGIAKLLADDESIAETQLTQLSGRALTPDYASPEQIKGEPLTTASDVYSLGVILYELLTGKRPYRLKLATPAQLEQAIIDIDPNRPSVRILQEARKEDRREAKRRAKILEGDLDTITMKALQKKTAPRYTSAAELALELKRHLAFEPIQARRESGWYAFEKFVRRNRLAVGGSVVIVASLTAGLIGTLWQAKLAREQTKVARLGIEREQAVGILYLETLTSVAGWDAKTFSVPGSVARMMTEKLAELEQRYDKSIDQKLALLETVATQLPYLGDTEGALTASKRFADALELIGTSPERLLSARSQTARTLHVARRYAEAEEMLKFALAAPDASGASVNVRARAMEGLASALQVQGKRQAAMQILSEALALPAGKFEAKLRGEMLQTRADSNYGFDSISALIDAKDGNAAMLSDPQIERAYVGASFIFLGATLFEAGQPSAAEAALLKSLDYAISLYGNADLETTDISSRLAQAIAAQGRFSEARELLAERVALVRQKGGAKTAVALQLLKTRQLEIELAFGDLKAASQFAEIDPKNADSNLNASVEKLLRESQFIRANGSPEVAASWIERRLRALSSEQRISGNAFKLQLTLAEIKWTSGAHDAALDDFKKLRALMKQEGATANWTYEQVVEWTAMIMALKGNVAEGVVLLSELKEQPSSRRVPPITQVDHADSLWRQAQVSLAAGQSSKVSELVREMQANLKTLHPNSPRNVDAAQLAAAVGQ
jgi:Protein kinase domain